MLCGAFCPQSPSCIYFHSNLFCSWFAEIGNHYTANHGGTLRRSEFLGQIVEIELQEGSLAGASKQASRWCKQGKTRPGIGNCGAGVRRSKVGVNTLHNLYILYSVYSGVNILHFLYVTLVLTLCEARQVKAQRGREVNTLARQEK